MKAQEVLRSVNDFDELGGLDGDNQLPISSVTVNICLLNLFGEKGPLLNCLSQVPKNLPNICKCLSSIDGLASNTHIQ